ncbi:MAG: hypothetical protein HY597_04085 [Candidatus Omnitrophica bacterium]|nr:hypothetical protein [Candidatus Omnitrophota bacterium]
MMTSILGWYLFFLGLAAGCVVVTLTRYEQVSPRWLRGVLMGLGGLLLARCALMAGLALSDDPQPWWVWHRLWFVTAMGLTLPAVLVIDQLLRHPALSPKKILRWCSPVLAACLIIVLCGRTQRHGDPLIGWVPQLTGFWRVGWAVGQTLFVLGFTTICVLVMRLMRSRSVRAALLALLLAFLPVGVQGLLVLLGRPWPPSAILNPFVEIGILCALGHAYDVALRRSS